MIDNDTKTCISVFRNGTNHTNTQDFTKKIAEMINLIEKK